MFYTRVFFPTRCLWLGGSLTFYPGGAYACPVRCVVYYLIGVRNASFFYLCSGVSRRGCPREDSFLFSITLRDGVLRRVAYYSKSSSNYSNPGFLILSRPKLDNANNC